MAQYTRESERKIFIPLILREIIFNNLSNISGSRVCHWEKDIISVPPNNSSFLFEKYLKLRFEIGYVKYSGNSKIPNKITYL